MALFKVAPVAPPAPLVGTQPPHESASIWMAGVVAPFAQNMIGGLGVFVVISVCGLAMWHGNARVTFTVAAVAGGLVFGLACAIRAFRDELALLARLYAEGKAEVLNEAIIDENRRLLAEVEHLKSEGMVAHAWGAREAAEWLVRDWYAGLAKGAETDRLLGRDQSMQRGMSRAQWEQGVAFLRNAGVLERGQRGGIWTAQNEDAALAAIARHAAVSRVSVRAANGDMTRL
jgi:hypothetical protein